jgi:hypothetical protein
MVNRTGLSMPARAIALPLSSTVLRKSFSVKIGLDLKRESEAPQAIKEYSNTQ